MIKLRRTAHRKADTCGDGRECYHDVDQQIQMHEAFAAVCEVQVGATWLRTRFHAQPPAASSTWARVCRLPSCVCGQRHCTAPGTPSRSDQSEPSDRNLLCSVAFLLRDCSFVSAASWTPPLRLCDTPQAKPAASGA
eukprot:3938011-Rhodomonas_salina.1